MSKTQLFYMNAFETIFDGQVYKIEEEEYGSIRTFMMKVASYIEESGQYISFNLRTTKGPCIIFQTHI